MPVIQPAIEKELAALLFVELKKVSPSPSPDAQASFDAAIQKQADAIALAVSQMITKAILGATIIAPPGTAGGPCVIS